MVGKRPTDARELEQRLDEYIGSLEVVSGDGHDSEFDDDDEVLNRLEDLGYV
jgi:hypothetical protein